VLFSTLESIATQDAAMVRLYDQELTLVPLSDEPILLVSSRPLLTQKECETLCLYFEQGPSEEGDAILECVRQQIDDLTGCLSHDGEAILPRYVSYPPSEGGDRLLPDGLHVDTNNGKFFRHVTALLYLTTNHNGATTFPLAGCKDTELERVAQAVLDSGVTHTLAEEQADKSQSRILENAAQDLYDGNSNVGLRVLPSMGKLCTFCNTLNDGTPDPLSFHCGEAGNDEFKALLTFFKEIPHSTFGSQQEFGQRVQETRQYLLDRYYTEL
jgi:hypothetical protein